MGVQNVGCQSSLNGAGSGVLLLCEGVATGQAYSRGLGLRGSRVLQLHSFGEIRFGSPHWQAPKLAIIVARGGSAAVAAVRGLRRRWRNIKIVVADLPNEEASILDVFAAGAEGVVLVQESLDQLRQALRAVLAGGLRLPPQVIRPFLDRLLQVRHLSTAGGSHSPLARLTVRQVEVLNCLARGESNKAIAARLSIEVRTVKRHVGDILRKLRVRSRFDAARIAAEHLGSGPQAAEG